MVAVDECGSCECVWTKLVSAYYLKNSQCLLRNRPTFILLFPLFPFMQQHGTNRYLPPEILSGTAGNDMKSMHQQDIYSMGLTLWEIVNCCPVKGEWSHHSTGIMIALLSHGQARAPYGFLGARNPLFFAQNAGFCFIF